MAHFVYAQSIYETYIKKDVPTFWEIDTIHADEWDFYPGICFMPDESFFKYLYDDQGKKIPDYTENEAWIEKQFYTLHKDTLFIENWGYEYSMREKKWEWDCLLSVYKIDSISDDIITIVELKESPNGIWVEHDEQAHMYYYRRTYVRCHCCKEAEGDMLREHESERSNSLIRSK